MSYLFEKYIPKTDVVIELGGEDAKITRDRDEILSSTHVILPGVGSFGDAMGKLRAYELFDSDIIRINKHVIHV